MAQVKRDNMQARGEAWAAEDEAKFKAPIRAHYETQGHPYYASARLWDDGVIDPAQTRRTLALALVGQPERADRTDAFRLVQDVMGMSGILHTIDARGVATLTLNRPERHNAFDDVLIGEITATLEGFAGDRAVRVVVLRSAGASFSAGADVQWMRRVADYTETENREDSARLSLLMHTLDRLPKPTLAVVQGAAYGGGVGLAACCDIVLASFRARFSLSEVRLGLIPAVISPYVIAAIGARQARRYFLTAEIIDAARALQIGLAHELAEPDALDARAEAIVTTLLQQAPGAQAEAKDLVFLCASRATDDALRQETAHRIAARRATPEGREGLSAFLEKRAPRLADGIAQCSPKS